MAVRRYSKDPPWAAQRRADEQVLRSINRGKFLGVDSAVEPEAIDHVQRHYQARRDTVASLGMELGVLRRAHGLTQEQVALVLGTKKSNISRLESGQYGGLTIEYFMAVLDAFRVQNNAASHARTRRSGIVRIKKVVKTTCDRRQLH